MRTVIIALVALIVSFSAGAYLITFERGAPPDQVAAPPVEFAQVVVAARSLDAGRTLELADYRTIDLPTSALSSAMIAADDPDVQRLVGAYATAPIGAGMPLPRESILFVEEGSLLSASIEPGKRAISIPVNESMTFSGLLEPGDVVDVLLTYSVGAQVLATALSGTGQAGGRDLRAAQAVIRGVRVLALDGRLRRSDEFSPGDPIRSVTLEVTPQQAEMVVLAMRLGDLSLALAPLRGEETSPWQAVTVDADVTTILRPGALLSLTTYGMLEETLSAQLADAIAPVEPAEGLPLPAPVLIQVVRGASSPSLE